MPSSSKVQLVGSTPQGVAQFCSVYCSVSEAMKTIYQEWTAWLADLSSPHIRLNFLTVQHAFDQYHFSSAIVATCISWIDRARGPWPSRWCWRMQSYPCCIAGFCILLVFRADSWCHVDGHSIWRHNYHHDHLIAIPLYCHCIRYNDNSDEHWIDCVSNSHYYEYYECQYYRLHNGKKETCCKYLYKPNQ